MNFSGRYSRDDHLFGNHLHRRICVACDNALIRIGDTWYRFEIHTDDNCRATECGSYSRQSASFTSIEASIAAIKVESILDEAIGIKQEIVVDIDDEDELCASPNTTAGLSCVGKERNPLDDDEVKGDPAEVYYEEENVYFDREDDGEHDGNEEGMDENEHIERGSQFNKQTHERKPRIKRTNPTPKKRSTAAKPYQCHHCNKAYAMRKNLHCHLRYVHGLEMDVSQAKPVVYTCQLCGVKFSQVIGYNAHIAEHLAETPHKCVVCQEPFLLEQTLGVHCMRMHKVSATNKPYDCDLCSTSFSSREPLLAHRRHVHATSGLLLQCDNCDERLATEQSLLAHIKRFHRDTDERRQYECFMCPKKFCLFKNLQFHMNVHSGAQPFVCVVCARAFYNPSALRQHLIAYHRPNVLVERTKKAKKAKVHVCSYCGKLFKFQCALREHVNLHTGEKPYQCKVCLKCFPSDRHMRNHQVTHSDRRPYVCDANDCRRGYKELRDLRRHKFNVHGLPSGTMFECPACQKLFPDNTLYRKHMRSHENESR